MMKILYVSTISNMINHFLIPHLKLLKDKGHQVDVAFNIEEDVRPEILELGCRVHDLEFQRTPFSKYNQSAYKKLKSLIEREGYDIVHTHSPVASACVRLACRNNKRTKVIYTAHGFHFYSGAPLKNWIIYYSAEKLLANWTDGLLTMNQEDYQNGKKLKLRSQDSVYYVDGVGVNLDEFKPQPLEEKLALRTEYGYDGDEFIMIYIAELSYRKNQTALINSMALLKDRLPNLKLLLVGKGPLRAEYEAQVKALGLEAQIEFLGYRDDILKLVKISDLGLSTSRQEGLPVNIMEIMATGLPVIVTNSRGNRDLVKDGENGYVIELGDEKGFAEAIEKLYSSKQLRAELGARGVELVKAYSLENVLAQMEEIYKRVIK